MVARVVLERRLDRRKHAAAADHVEVDGFEILAAVVRGRERIARVDGFEPVMQPDLSWYAEVTADADGSAETLVVHDREVAVRDGAARIRIADGGVSEEVVGVVVEQRPRDHPRAAEERGVEKAQPEAELLAAD